MKVAFVYIKQSTWYSLSSEQADFNNCPVSDSSVPVFITVYAQEDLHFSSSVGVSVTPQGGTRLVFMDYLGSPTAAEGESTVAMWTALVPLKPKSGTPG